MAFAVFGRGLFLEPLAELLPAVDLARFSSASTRFYSQAAALARAAIRAQHGLMILDGGTMAEMHTLDCMPETLNFDLREFGGGRSQSNIAGQQQFNSQGKTETVHGHYNGFGPSTACSISCLPGVQRSIREETLAGFHGGGDIVQL